MQVSPLSVRFILIPCMAAWRPHILFPDLWTPRGLLQWPTRPENRPPSRIPTQRALRWICLAWDLRPDKSKFRPRSHPLPAASCRFASLPVATTATHGAAAQRKQLSGLAMELDKVCQASCRNMRQEHEANEAEKVANFIRRIGRDKHKTTLARNLLGP